MFLNIGFSLVAIYGTPDILIILIICMMALLKSTESCKFLGFIKKTVQRQIFYNGKLMLWTY